MTLLIKFLALVFTLVSFQVRASAPLPPLAAFVAAYYAASKYSCLGKTAILENNLCEDTGGQITGCHESAFSEVNATCALVEAAWQPVIFLCLNENVSFCDCYQETLNTIALSDTLSIVDEVSQFSTCIGAFGCSVNLSPFFSGFAAANFSYASCEAEKSYIATLEDVSSCSLTCPPTASPTNTPSSSPSAQPSASPSSSPSESPSSPPTLSPTNSPSSPPTAKPSPLPTPFPKAPTSCISGDMIVIMQDGTNKHVKDLKVGDLVHVGLGMYEPIIWLTEHRDSQNQRGNALIQALYVEILLSSNHRISVTPNHYVVTANGERLAKDIKLNDTLVLGSEGKTATVLSIDRKFKTGVFNPQTPSQKLVINGVQVSTRTEGSPPFWFMSRSFQVLNLLFNLLPEGTYATLIVFLCECVYEPIYYSELQVPHLLIASLLGYTLAKEKK